MLLDVSVNINDLIFKAEFKSSFAKKFSNFKLCSISLKLLGCYKMSVKKIFKTNLKQHYNELSEIRYTII